MSNSDCLLLPPSFHPTYREPLYERTVKGKSSWTSEKIIGRRTSLRIIGRRKRDKMVGRRGALKMVGRRKRDKNGRATGWSTRYIHPNKTYTEYIYTHIALQSIYTPQLNIYNFAKRTSWRPTRRLQENREP